MWTFLAFLVSIDFGKFKTLPATQTFANFHGVANAAIKGALDTGTIGGCWVSKLTRCAKSAVFAIVAIQRAKNASLSLFLFDFIVEEVTYFTRSALFDRFSTTTLTIRMAFWTCFWCLIVVETWQTSNTDCYIWQITRITITITLFTRNI